MFAPKCLSISLLHTFTWAAFWSSSLSTHSSPPPLLSLSLSLFPFPNLANEPGWHFRSNFIWHAFASDTFDSIEKCLASGCWRISFKRTIISHSPITCIPQNNSHYLKRLYIRPYFIKNIFDTSKYGNIAKGSFHFMSIPSIASICNYNDGKLSAKHHDERVKSLQTIKKEE